MGTLDDAIREHLELKRQQGASDEELERKEAEALGRRSAAAEPPPAEPRAAEPPVAEPPVEEPAPVAEESSSPASEAEPGFLEEPDPPAVDPEAARNGSSAHDSVDLFDQDLGEGRSSPSDEPVVRRTRPAAEPDPEPGEEPAEDFLEDTPDFLEETPEHDRLWFEQKPPKDFDFD